MSANDSGDLVMLSIV